MNDLETLLPCCLFIHSLALPKMSNRKKERAAAVKYEIDKTKGTVCDPAAKARTGLQITPTIKTNLGEGRRADNINTVNF